MPGRFAERGFLILLAAAGLAAGCAREPVEKVETREAMNTVITVRVVAHSDLIARRALDDAWKEMDECIRLLDCHRPDSHISQINQSEPPFKVFVHPLVANCLAAAKEVWEETGGAFDPTVGPLLELWRKAAEEGKEPQPQNIAEALGRVGMDKVEIEMETMMVARDVTARPPRSALPSQEDLLEPAHLVGFNREGMKLDLGGIAKGYIIGRMVRRMERAGATAALVDAGGDVYATGRRPPSLIPPGGDPRWLVGVQDPRAPAQSPDEPWRLFTRLHIGDLAVATSGHYYRGFTIAGKRRSHIIDPWFHPTRPRPTVWRRRLQCSAPKRACNSWREPKASSACCLSGRRNRRLPSPRTTGRSKRPSSNIARRALRPRRLAAARHTISACPTSHRAGAPPPSLSGPGWLLRTWSAREGAEESSRQVECQGLLELERHAGPPPAALGSIATHHPRPGRKLLQKKRVGRVTRNRQPDLHLPAHFGGLLDQKIRPAVADVQRPGPKVGPLARFDAQAARDLKAWMAAAFSGRVHANAPSNRVPKTCFDRPDSIPDFGVACNYDFGRRAPRCGTVRGRSRLVGHIAHGRYVGGRFWVEFGGFWADSARFGGRIGSGASARGLGGRNVKMGKVKLAAFFDFRRRL